MTPDEVPHLITPPEKPRSSLGLWVFSAVALLIAVTLVVRYENRNAASLRPDGTTETVVTVPGATQEGGARVRVLSEPAGASVFINGKLLGPTPLVIGSFAAGTYGLRIERNGCLPVNQSLTVTSTDSAVEHKLDPLPTGAVSIAVKPDGAEVLLDGELLGYTPVSIPAVPVGPHELLIRKTNFEPYTTRFDVSAGEEQVFADFELKDKVFAMLDGLLKREPQRLAHYIDLGHYLFVNNRMDESVEVWAQGLEMVNSPVDFDGPGFSGAKNMTREEMNLEIRLRREDEARFNKELEKHRNWPGKSTRVFREKLELARETINSKNIGSWEWADRAAQMNLRNRGYEKAARIYNDHIKAVPVDAPSLYKAYTALVKVQLLARDTVEAQNRFNEFARNFATNGAALRYFGAEIYPYQDRFTTKGRIQVLEMAEKVFRLALPLTADPVEKAQCQFDLGAVLNYLNKSQEAVALLEESVAGTADEVIKEERSLRLADAYRRNQRLDDALALYQKLAISERTGIRESAKTGLVYVESDRKAKKKD